MAELKVYEACFCSLKIKLTARNWSKWAMAAKTFKRGRSARVESRFAHGAGESAARRRISKAWVKWCSCKNTISKQNGLLVFKKKYLNLMVFINILTQVIIICISKHKLLYCKIGFDQFRGLLLLL